MSGQAFFYNMLCVNILFRRQLLYDPCRIFHARPGYMIPQSLQAVHWSNFRIADLYVLRCYCMSGILSSKSFSCLFRLTVSSYLYYTISSIKKQPFKLFYTISCVFAHFFAVITLYLVVCYIQDWINLIIIYYFAVFCCTYPAFVSYTIICQ